MANIYKADIVDVNLETGNIFRSFLSRSIGYKDDDADRFGIRAFRDGVPQDLSGASCQAIFMAPDGTNVALTSYGTVADNMAYVTLPPACYDVEGQFTLAIKLVGDGVTSTVRIVDGVVANTGASGAVSPTSAVPTYQEIIAQFDAMVAATAAATGSIAETFNGSNDYEAGKYVINSGALYKLTADHAAGTTWSNTKKEAAFLGDGVTEIAKYMPTLTTLKTMADLSSGYYIGNASSGDNWTSKLVSNTGSLYTATAIDLIDYMDDSLMIEIASGDSHSGSRQHGFCDENNIITWQSQEKFLSFKANGNVLQARLNVENRYFFFSCSSKTLLNIYVESEGVIIKKIYSQAYVAPGGSDSNHGTKESPFATINHALEVGASRIMVSGGKYSQTIDMKNAKNRDVEIFNYTPTMKAVFYAPDCVIAEEETAVSGFTRVYKATTDKSFATNNIWIFQDGVADERTEISAEERQPEQRGYKYRCYDTMIRKCSETTLDAALTEIENASDFRWFVDSGTIYFSRPEAVSAANPICGGFGSSFFNNMNRQTTIRMTGIDVKYMDVHIVYSANSVIKDCSCGNVFGGTCFDMSRAVEAVFIRCEAYRAFTGTNGDGFNGHSQNSDDAFAHQTTAVLIDCWSHDNRDDGVSLHERSEFTVIGGLYEHNSFGGGITPANGSHCTCIGVTARHNGEGGFLYMNPTASSEGGVGGQIKCIDCVSDSNNTWSSVISAGYKINAEGNKGIMVNCKAFNEDNGFYVEDENGAMELTDCGAANCTNVIGGQTMNLTIKNTTLVT